MLLLRFVAVHRRAFCRRSRPPRPRASTTSSRSSTTSRPTDGNGAATRNARLAAIHAFARYAASNHPEHLDLCQRILAVPFKRATPSPRRVSRSRRDPCAASMLPIARLKTGRRDHALLLALFNTGARVQEILDLRPCDIQLVRPLQVRLRGKGRKERVCPLWPQTAEILRALLAEHGLDSAATQPLFRNHRGEPLTRFGVRYLLRKYASLARPAATDAGRQARPPARAAAHDRGPPPSSRRRPRDDQSLARARQRRDHQPLRSRGPRDEARRRCQGSSRRGHRSPPSPRGERTQAFSDGSKPSDPAPPNRLSLCGVTPLADQAVTRTSVGALHITRCST